MLIIISKEDNLLYFKISIQIGTEMHRRGFFSNFFRTMFDFYGGMFRLTFFLPFVLMQVIQKLKTIQFLK